DSVDSAAPLALPEPVLQPVVEEVPAPAPSPAVSEPLTIEPVALLPAPAEPPLAPVTVEPHLQFFGLRENPFELTPDPRFWYPSTTHRHAVATVLHGIQTRKGVITLTGGAGTGKTLVLEYVTDHLRDAHVEFALIMNSRLTTEEFF